MEISAIIQSQKIVETAVGFFRKRKERNYGYLGNNPRSKNC